MAVPANGFRRLHQMLDLRQIRVGVAVIHQRIEKLRRFPNALLALLQSVIFLLFAEHEVEGLVLVVEPVEFGHTGHNGGIVDAKFRFRFALAIAARNKLAPPVFDCQPVACLGHYCRHNATSVRTHARDRPYRQTTFAERRLQVKIRDGNTVAGYKI